MALFEGYLLLLKTPFRITKPPFGSLKSSAQQLGKQLLRVTKPPDNYKRITFLLMLCSDVNQNWFESPRVWFVFISIMICILPSECITIDWLTSSSVSWITLIILFPGWRCGRRRWQTKTFHLSICIQREKESEADQGGPSGLWCPRWDGWREWLAEIIS